MAIEGGDSGTERAAPRGLLAVLLQDIETAPDDGSPRLRRGTAPDRIVSTTDAQMRHGRESAAQRFDGYEATVVTDIEGGVILATDVQAANVPDREHAVEWVAEAAACAGQPVACVLADAAYGDRATRDLLGALGAEGIASAPPGRRRGMFSRDDFTVDDDTGTAVCPAGQHALRRDLVHGADPGWRYIFSRRHCGPCPPRARCTKSVRGPRILQTTAESERRQPLRRIQRTAASRHRIRRRIGVEHRIARLVQVGVRQARYRGRAKVAFQVALAAAVANLTLTQNAAPAPRPSATALAVLTERVRDLAYAFRRGLRLVFECRPARFLGLPPIVKIAPLVFTR